MMKVIFHVIEEDKWQVTIDNAVDVLEQYPDAQIEIICMSDAARVFGRFVGLHFEKLAQKSNVQFVIGEQGLKNNNLSEDMLPVSFIVEPSVVRRIVKLQNEGYAYIRL